jgi:hypothetical protein
MAIGEEKWLTMIQIGEAISHQQPAFGLPYNRQLERLGGSQDSLWFTGANSSYATVLLGGNWLVILLRSKAVGANQMAV